MSTQQASPRSPFLFGDHFRDRASRQRKRRSGEVDLISNILVVVGEILMNTRQILENDGFEDALERIGLDVCIIFALVVFAMKLGKNRNI